MTGAQVIPPFPVFTDVDGNPVDDGYIFVGTEGLDPIASPVSVFWDRALTIPATQPIRTIGGYPSNLGVRSVFYSSSAVYSILVRNKNGTAIYSENSFVSSVGWKRNLLSGAVNTVGHMLDQQSISVWEFESLITSKPTPSDPNTWDWYPAIQGAIDYATVNGPTTIMLAMCTMGVSSPVTMKSNTWLMGYGDISSIQGRFSSPTNRIITSSATVLQKNIRLLNFMVDRTVVNSQHGILLGGIDNLLIEGVHVFGAVMTVDSGAMGISAFDAFAQIQSKNVTVRRCIITRCNNFGIAFGNVSGGSIDNNEFYDCWREAIGLEAWGNGVVSGGNPLGTLGVVEGVHADKNTLRMSTDPANHFVGSVGPAMLIGGATSNGKVNGNTCTSNTIIIANPAAITNYHGISITGSPTQETSGNVISDNVIISAPGSAVAMGALGQITNDNIITDNIAINCGAASASGAFALRATSGNLVTDNKAVGTTHAWMIDEQTGADNNVFLDNLSTGHNQAYAKLNGVNSILRDPRVAQLAGGVIAQESLTIINNASADTRVRGAAVNRALCLISSNLGGNYALLLLNSTAAPVVISKSLDVAVGATDPGTAASLNVFPISSTSIRLTNRLGSDRSFSVTIFGVA